MTRDEAREILADEYAKRGVTGIDVEPGQEQKQRAIGDAIIAAILRAANSKPQT